MQIYPWRRFKSDQASCTLVTESGVNYTSHHLRCNLTTLSHTPSKGRTTTRRRRPHQQAISRAWPGSASPNDRSDIDDYNVNVYSTVRHSDSSYAPSDLRDNRASTWSTTANPPTPTCPTTPSRCHVRSTSLLAFFLSMLFILSFANLTIAVPLNGRQAIPDKSGQTGNAPAPVKCQPPPRPANTSTSTTAPSFTFSPSASASISASAQPSVGVPGANGNANAPGELGSSPRPSPTPLAPIFNNISLSASGVAAIAGGGLILVFLIILLSVWIYRRRHIKIDEIPIRRSKLGSRLGWRIFGDAPPSRSASRQSKQSYTSRASSPTSSRSRKNSKTEMKEVESGWLDKRTISRPKPAWSVGDNGLLDVPKPGSPWMTSDKDLDDRAPWVNKVSKERIGAPRPARPASAQPLGRLSGMGLGMGYLK